MRLFLAGTVFIVSGCSSTPQKVTTYGPRVIPVGAPVPKGGGHFKLGAPYVINGRTYVPRHDPHYDQAGIASWYGEDFHGRRTANGEIYDMGRLTAAHPTLPLPSLVAVTNTANGRTIIVRVNDRGPYAKNRIIDLSRRTADLLGLKQAGTGTVRVRYLSPAPLDGDDTVERRSAEAMFSRMSRSAGLW